ncbi:hypothetical protein C8T65DRAFT_75163 [Cerioporus squamosus]|nr:hypothetical protein C8T65DRAFT_75163 [Cerioporus squamosus]
MRDSTRGFRALDCSAISARVRLDALEQCSTRSSSNRRPSSARERRARPSAPKKLLHLVPLHHALQAQSAQRRTQHTLCRRRRGVCTVRRRAGLRLGRERDERIRGVKVRVVHDGELLEQPESNEQRPPLRNRILVPSERDRQARQQPGRVHRQDPAQPGAAVVFPPEGVDDHAVYGRAVGAGAEAQRCSVRGGVGGPDGVRFAAYGRQSSR